MKRHTDWRRRLIAYVDEARRRPFAIGTHDCALFVAGAVEAMTGEDPAANLRGTYHSYVEGLKQIRRQGYIDHVDATASLFSRVPGGPAHAQVGDLAVIATRDGFALGVVGGARIFAVGEEGLMTVDLLTAKQVFRV